MVNVPIVLFSDGYFEKEELQGCVDAAIEKDMDTWCNIKAKISKV